ncbi:MAG TPA: hypothetical protein VI072_35860 [Polyangiaceae bacterium]
MTHSVFSARWLLAVSAAIGALSCSSSDEGSDQVPGESPDARPRLRNAKCQPKPGPDLPDERGFDSNCDGIDGDLRSAIFVAPGGVETASGEPAAPVGTLSRAIALAQSSARDVYVCSGIYSENVVVERAGVHVYGGFDCTKGWARTREPAVVAPSSGKPLRIVGTSDVLFQGVNFRAPDAARPGESSVAVTVIDSKQVRIENSVLEAGRGAPGKAGEPAAPPVTSRPESAANGGSAPRDLECGLLTVSSPACQGQLAGGLSAARPYTCAGAAGLYLGGWGGRGENAGPYASTTGTHGVTGSPASTNPRRLRTREGNPISGRQGRAGVSGGDGDAAKVGFGALVNGEYLPSNTGTDGKPGGIGEAGDGGDGGRAVYDAQQARWYLGGGGGQGGFPGCGGGIGRGGGGGGASVALVVVSSTLALQNLSIVTADGGVGGRPSAGSAGQPGGEPGQGGTGMQNATVDTTGAVGGRGGDGGPGGNGGPGAGGPSLGIVVLGDEPDVLLTTYQIGKGGAGAAGLAGAPAAAAGIAANIRRVE